MIKGIIGFFWITIGLIGFIRPDSLKNRLKKKIPRRIGFIVTFFLFVLGFTLAGIILKTNTLTTRLAGIIGAIIVIKSVILVTNKSNVKLIEWLRDKPVSFYRVWAVMIFFLGVYLLWR